MALQHEKMGKWGPWKGTLLPKVSKWVTESSEKRRRASRILLWSKKYEKNTSQLWASLVAWMVKYLPSMWETQVQSPGREDPLEQKMATHSSILGWRIPWTEEPGGYSPWGPRVGHDWASIKVKEVFFFFKKKQQPWDAQSMKCKMDLHLLYSICGWGGG